MAGFILRVCFSDDAVEQVLIVGGEVDRITDVVRTACALDPTQIVAFSVYADSTVVKACSLAADFTVEFVEIKGAGRRAGFGGGHMVCGACWVGAGYLKTAVTTPLMLRYTLLRKALSTNGVATRWVRSRSP